MKRPKTALGFALGILSFASAARATDYVVSPNGSDSGSGLAAAPFKTIQHAVAAAKPGDTVTVEDGSYEGFWMKNGGGTASARITIRAKNKGGAKITGPSATASDPADAVQLVSVSYVTIDGFDVSGAARAGISIRTLGDTTGADTTDDVVQNCRSHDNGGGTTAGRHDGIFTGFARNVTIVSNEVDHNAEHGIYVSNSADNPTISGNVSHENRANGLQINADVSTGGDGIITGWRMENNVVWGNGGAAAINLDGACNGLLANNLVYGNANGGITLFQGDAATASHSNVIVNNTVYDASGARSAIQIADGANDNVVFNNVLYSKSTGMEIQSVTGLVHDYNLVSSYSGGGASAHEASPAVAQIFVGASGNDDRPGPAAVGKGTASLGGASAPAKDIAGNARNASAEDIGCYASGAAPGGGGGGGRGAVDAGAEGSDAGLTLDAGGGVVPPPSDGADAGGASNDMGASASTGGCNVHASPARAAGSAAAILVAALLVARRLRAGRAKP